MSRPWWHSGLWFGVVGASAAAVHLLVFEATRHVLDLVKERGAEVPWTVAMAESGLTRARFEALFADYDDLFDAVAQTG